MKTLNCSIFVVPLLGMVLSACGGGSGDGSSAKADAFSRRNAFNASLKGSSGVAGASQNQAQRSSSESQSSTGGFSSLSFSSSSETENFEEDFSFRNVEVPCEISGNAIVNLSVDNQGFDEGMEFLEMTIESQFNECVEEESGKVSGPLSMNLRVQFSAVSLMAMTMTLNGNLQAEGKNKDGQMVPHKMEFENLRLSVEAMSGSLEEDDLSLASPAVQVNCTGSLKLDGKAQDCLELLQEEATDEEKGKSTSSESSSTRIEDKSSLYASTLNGHTQIVFIIEGTKPIAAVEEVYLEYQNELLAMPFHSDSLTAENRSTLKDLMGEAVESFFSKYSEEAIFVHVEGFDLQEFENLVVDIAYVDGSVEKIRKSL